MKTAISISDELFAAAEAAAKRQGVSRSQFYAQAVAAWLERNGDEVVTEQLNEVYADSDSSLDESLVRMQELSLPEEEW